MKPTKQIKAKIPHAKKNNSCMTDFGIYSRKQIEFGIFIRNFRREYNLSQQQFARLASVFARQNISPVTISHYETFKNVPCEANMQAIMKVMHITPHDLV